MLWRSTAPVRHPPGFVAPCLPTNARAVPMGPMWVYEIKHDGFRFIRQIKLKLLTFMKFMVASPRLSLGRNQALWPRPGVLRGACAIQTAPAAFYWLGADRGDRPAARSGHTSSLARFDRAFG
jgi:hypothetical protein